MKNGELRFLTMQQGYLVIFGEVLCARPQKNFCLIFDVIYLELKGYQFGLPSRDGGGQKGVSGGGILPSKISSLDHSYYKDKWASILQQTPLCYSVSYYSCDREGQKGTSGMGSPPLKISGNGFFLY